MSTRKPRIALVLGDPSGIGPELVARLLANPDTLKAADVLVIADPKEVTKGMEVAGQHTLLTQFSSLDAVSYSQGFALLAHKVDQENGYKCGVCNEASGAYALQTLKIALEAVTKGFADVLLFAPLNKQALHLAGMQTSDELHWFAEQMNFKGPVCEFNVLDGLWTSRVTSHVAHKEVAALLTQRGVEHAIDLLSTAIQASGVKAPRIAVCGLNPHNGDNGNFGDEEIRIIAPGVVLAAQQGVEAEGPFPADTAFVRAIRKDNGYDGVVTMYHDQGQIAMKLMGFEKGVTVHGGLPIPISTPAHGTAYDIVGQDKANIGAMLNAFELACKMGISHRKNSSLSV